MTCANKSKFILKSDVPLTSSNAIPEVVHSLFKSYRHKLDANHISLKKKKYSKSDEQPALSTS